MRNHFCLAALLALSAGSSACVSAAVPLAAAPVAAEPFRARAPTEEIIYFVLPDRFANGDAGNDRGGLKGDRLKTGFDPTHKAFYLGGDLKGLTARLDYIRGLGATAIWLGPIYKNKPVQGPTGDESAGYHGYWITDFTQVDPHFGGEADLRAFVDAAHARGMKVYLDIITNHTADVIAFRECNPCAYRPLAEGPPYTAYVPAGEEEVKVPGWLNNPRWYHNRGNTTFQGENSRHGDFFGLDDLATEDPHVVQGFIDIFGSWIDRYRIDGFRIDTVQHVNPEFWQVFAPAMLERARAEGIPNFHLFAEVATSEMNPGYTARWSHISGIPAMLDFAFSEAVHQTAGGNAGTSVLEQLFNGDVLYKGGEGYALQQPTFIGNHDQGRFAMFVDRQNPAASAEEKLARVKLGHAMLFLFRGVPTVYSGDEQGFVGRGGDQSARQPLFASQVAEYNAQPLVGTASTTAADNFDSRHPLYQLIQQLSAARQASKALRAGKQVTRWSEPQPGLFAASRFDPETGREVVVLFNTSPKPVSMHVVVERRSTTFTPLVGQCAPAVRSTGSYPVTLPAFGFAACAATE